MRKGQDSGQYWSTIHVPLLQYFSSDTGGLPVTVQCVTLPYQEELCLRVMKDLETGLATRQSGHYLRSSKKWTFNTEKYPMYSSEQMGFFCTCCLTEIPVNMGSHFLQCCTRTKEYSPDCVTVFSTLVQIFTSESVSLEIQFANKNLSERKKLYSKIECVHCCYMKVAFNYLNLAISINHLFT